MTATSSAQLLQAAWIAPMDTPLIREGAVVHEHGRIIDVGTAEQLRSRYPHIAPQDLGASILFPGLVNAHVHLELSDCQCGSPPSDGFGPWLLNLVKRNAVPPSQLQSTVTAAVKIGAEQCLRFGVTSVGDITRQPALTRPLLCNGPLRVTSYGEIQALALRRNLFPDRFSAATDRRFASEHLRVGLSPHAPYTVEPFAYLACRETAKRDHLPLATHLAESRQEDEFLANHSGPFRELWEAIGQWDGNVPHYHGGPIRFAQMLGLLNYPTLLAHVNYCDDDELRILADGVASIVYCPRTHRYFGHPPHRWRDMLQRGLNVSLGTDSCASSPDLNLLDDARLLHQSAPDFPTHALWEMITIRGAKSIGRAHEVGSIARGKYADFVAFAVSSDDPLGEVLEKNQLPIGTWIGGEFLVPSSGLRRAQSSRTPGEGQGGGS